MGVQVNLSGYQVFFASFLYSQTVITITLHSFIIVLQMREYSNHSQKIIHFCLANFEKHTQKRILRVALKVQCAAQGHI